MPADVSKEVKAIASAIVGEFTVRALDTALLVLKELFCQAGQPK